MPDTGAPASPDHRRDRPRPCAAAPRSGRRRHRPQPVLRRVRRRGAEPHDRPIRLCHDRAVAGWPRAFHRPRYERDRNVPADMRAIQSSKLPLHAGVTTRMLKDFGGGDRAADPGHLVRRCAARIGARVVLGAGRRVGGGVPRPCSPRRSVRTTSLISRSRSSGSIWRWPAGGRINTPPRSAA